MNTVLVRGESIAACCCASLLGQAGVPFCREIVSRPKLPVIMLSESTQHLLADIFPQDHLFNGLPQIRRRMVKWGIDAPLLALPHAAIVASEQTLLDRIEPLLAATVQQQPGAPPWSIYSSRPLPHGSEDFHFGSRLAEASSVTLNQDCDAEASWVESLANGWLFLLPNGSTAWLLSVGASAESLLSESVLIAPHIARLSPTVQSFPCHPRIAHPLCGSGWIACGSAALGFDPLCGDGTGNAAREAILATAVVRAAALESTATDLLTHYRARLLAAFERHLQVCAEFYRSGRSGPWWDEQISETEQGVLWCRAQRALAHGYKYRLIGFSLEPIFP